MAPLLLAGAFALWEGAWWARRRALRTSVYAQALSRARALGRPLLVVGAPDGGVTAGYGCGDITVDAAPSACPGAMRADITRELPIRDASVVVFVSCVLEYVGDYRSAIHELQRISGGEIFLVRVEPWTATAYLYPGARRTISR